MRAYNFGAKESSLAKIYQLPHNVPLGGVIKRVQLLRSTIPLKFGKAKTSKIWRD